MLAYERKQQILEILRGHNNMITIERLCALVYASSATIRRDLKDLETSGLIRRTHGGAILVEGSSSEDPLAYRESQNSIKKQTIATLALEHIRDGMTLFLDSSSTVATLAQRLEHFNNLKVITNGLKTALLLSDYKDIKVMCTGGSLRENSKSLVGLAARDYVARFHADLAFLSCRGFSIENGVSEASEEEYYVKKQYIANSHAAILLCDTSKMDVDFFCRLAPLSDFYRIITEKKSVNDLCDSYTSCGKQAL